MFNFKKIGKKVLSSVLGATLAMGGFLNTQIVKADEPDVEKYWDAYTMLSNAEFILGEDKKEEIEKLKEDIACNSLDNITNECKEKLDNLLSQNENAKAKAIYDAVEKCITDKEANLERLSNVEGLNEIEEVEGLNEDLQCKIAKFKENEKEKAIVFIVVPKNGTLTKENMKRIENALEHSKKNVNFIIRPQCRNDKFKIGGNVIYEYSESIINLQGATISGNNLGVIDSCKNTKINFNGANISKNKDFVIYGCEGAKINFNGVNISKNKLGVIYGCEGAKINFNRATISGNNLSVIHSCKNTKINFNGVNISENELGVIYDCEGAKINFNGVNILKNKNFVIDSCEGAKINFNRVTISENESFVIYDCEGAEINFNETNISENEDFVIDSCKNTKINFNGVTISENECFVIYDYKNPIINFNEEIFREMS